MLELYLQSNQKKQLELVQKTYLALVFHLKKITLHNEPKQGIK